jgi:hypothetical protein
MQTWDSHLEMPVFRCHEFCLAVALRRISFTVSLRLAKNRICLHYKGIRAAMPSRRAHTKSRLGCIQCKARRVKVGTVSLVCNVLRSPGNRSAIKLTHHVIAALGTRRLAFTAKSKRAPHHQLRQRLRIVMAHILNQQQR